MSTRQALLVLAFLGVASADMSDAGPEVRSWVLTASTNPAVRAIAPDVHSVRADENFVYVESAGLSLHSFGALEANQYAPPLGPRQFTFRFPRHPKPAEGEAMSAPLGVIGAFVTGVPIYNPIGTASYRDQNIWHRDAVAASRLGTSQLVTALNANGARHSPIVGFALDGYPIYGPYGWDAAGSVKRMTSSYRLRAARRRMELPDGTALTPSQEGPDVGDGYPAGMFAEDYEYVAGSGDLDEHNGRFTRTPEYPQGTYAYFMTASWPYLVGPSYAGQVPDWPSAPKEDRPVSLTAYNLKANEPARLTLVFRDAKGRRIRFLEKVHEQPIHMVAVSKDLAEFAHIHPEPALGDVFTVTHTFPHGGEYTVYADYTAPGAQPDVARFDLTVAGEPAPPAPPCPDGERTKTAGGVTVRLDAPPRIEAGADVPLSFTLNVRDVQPWLGAWAHIMIVSGDRKQFIHAHPLESTAAGADPAVHVHTAPVAGPSPETIRTVTGFREPGIYKLWFQFQRQGEVTTIPWVLKVERAERTASPVSEAAAPGTIAVTVGSRGFEPARLTIPANRATKIAFTRTDAQNCASEVAFPELGIRKRLPPGQTVTVDIPPTRGGELHFACGMGMYRGALTVQ